VPALIEPMLASDEDSVADDIEDDEALGDVCLFKSGGTMPLVTVFNLRREDRLSDVVEATRRALTSMPELAINDDEIDRVPILSPADFDGEVTRINVDLWERTERTKEALQELATRLARAFQATAGADRRVKVVIRPYDVERSGWVSL
jgi:phenylpyruvate tautomerase PptA (4-oxalocrotonate tautomerase family)